MNANQPIYQQLADLLREKIADGEYVLGDALPSERAMADRYGISHLTVRKSFALLEEEGLLIRIQGKGTFVTIPRISMDMNKIQGFRSFLEDKGVHVTNEVLHCGLRKARHKYAKLLNIDENDDVFECVRLRLGNGYPMAVEYNAVPSRYVSGIEQYDFKVYSLHDAYASHHIRIASEHQMLEVIKVTNPQAQLLRLDENSCVFLLSSYSKDESGRIIEYTRIYNSDERIVFYVAAD